MSNEIIAHVFFPKGALGASDDDDALDTILRQIAIAASADPEEEWADKYGTNVDNDVFMMHRYCWCDADDCPWCAGCTCPEEAWSYYIDGQHVAREKYQALWGRMTPPMPFEEHKHGTAEYEAYDAWWRGEIDKRNARLSVVHTPMCRFCTDGYSEHGGEPGMGAPNFWYKPTGLKVWWYKYIGRDTEVRGPATDPDEMLGACMSAICMPSVSGCGRRSAGSSRRRRRKRSGARQPIPSQRCASGPMNTSATPDAIVTLID